MSANIAVRNLIEDYWRWAAFCLLSPIGHKIIYESFKINILNSRMADFGIVGDIVEVVPALCERLERKRSND